MNRSGRLIFGVFSGREKPEIEHRNVPTLFEADREIDLSKKRFCLSFFFVAAHDSIYSKAASGG